MLRFDINALKLIARLRLTSIHTRTYTFSITRKSKMQQRMPTICDIFRISRVCDIKEKLCMDSTIPPYAALLPFPFMHSAVVQ